MIIKQDSEREALLRCGAITAHVLTELADLAREGMETAYLNDVADRRIRERGGIPSFLNYRPDGSHKPYPAAICACINDEAVHAIPSRRILQDGDVLSIDLGVNFRGTFTDAATTIGIGKVPQEAERLMEITKAALSAGIAAAYVQAHVGDIGEAIERVVTRAGFRIVRSLTGHGVGRAVHEDPLIYNYGHRGGGVELREEIVIAIEPIVAAGNGEVILGKDGFSYRSRDGSVVAHEEHTILITKDGPVIITKLG